MWPSPYPLALLCSWFLSSLKNNFSVLSKYFLLQVGLQVPPAVRGPVLAIRIGVPLVQAVHFDWPVGQTHTMKDQIQCKILKKSCCAMSRRQKEETKPNKPKKPCGRWYHLCPSKAVCHLSGETWKIWWLSLNTQGDSEWDFWLVSQASYEKGFQFYNTENWIQFGSIILWHSWTTDWNAWCIHVRTAT